MSLAWSYSSLSAFETCPHRYYLTKVTKQVKEPQTAAMSDGNAAHKAMELCLKGQQALPEKYAKFAPLVERVRATPAKIETERKFALNEAYKETTYFAKDVWLRGVFDVAVVGTKSAALLDWKTGKVKNDVDQLRLFAAAAFKLYPFVEKVSTGYVWLNHGTVHTEKFERDESPGIWQDFGGRVRRIEIAAEKNQWPKQPSGLCRSWCPVGNSLCEHCGT